MVYTLSRDITARITDAGVCRILTQFMNFLCMTLNLESQVCSKCVRNQGAHAFPRDNKCRLLHCINFNIIRQVVISGFCHEVDENCALVGYYVASSSNFLLMFWDNLSIPSSVLKNPKESLLP